MAILGKDNRERVRDTTAKPWRHVCALKVTTDGKQTFVASGVMVGPRTVLTSAFVLRTPDSLVRSVTITPAMDGKTAPFGSAVAAPEQFRFDRDVDPRFAGIVLDNDSLAEAGAFAVAALSDDDLKKAELWVGGYPADRESGKHQCYDSGRASFIEADTIHYEIDTFGGQSGSPIWTTLGGGDAVMVGLHSSGGPTANSGYRVTPAVLATINSWRTPLVTPPPPDVDITLARVLERLANIENALQTLVGRLPAARSDLDRQLKSDLVDALMDIPSIERPATRNALIAGIKFVSIGEVSSRVDFVNLLEDIGKADPPSYLTLVDNAFRMVKGTELGRKLDTLSGRFNEWLAGRKPDS